MSKLNDVAGLRFGKIVALEYTKADGRGKWKCKCDCGAITYANADNLKKMKFGCKECALKEMTSRLNDVTGQRFGYLTVVQRDPACTGKGKWICACDCGNSHHVLGSNLRSGKTTSCMACSITRRSAKRRRHAAGEIPSTYWQIVVDGARSRDIYLDITAEYGYALFQAQKGLCALSGVAIAFRDCDTRRHTASLDRIDSSKGYVKGNVQWVHKTVNMMKRDLGEPDFLVWCRRLVEYAAASS